jgi:DNA-binding response OmpR family regulator
MKVDCAYDGEEALKLARENTYDMILLDIMLPKFDGFEVCRQIREFSDVPIIMLTAKGDDMDKILGLDYGADDYITKPFNPVELQARVKSQLRRYMQLGSAQPVNTKLVAGGIEMDDRAKEVTLDGEPVNLTRTEYDILKLLMEHKGEVFSPNQIYEEVWNDSPYGIENTVAVHIRHLREKLEYNPAEPRYLKVVWGRGYKMEETE